MCLRLCPCDIHVDKSEYLNRIISEIPGRNSKMLFLRFLEILEGKIRKRIYFMLEYFK
jgi:hypothetical protein